MLLFVAVKGVKKKKTVLKLSISSWTDFFAINISIYLRGLMFQWPQNMAHMPTQTNFVITNPKTHTEIHLTPKV